MFHVSSVNKARRTALASPCFRAAAGRGGRTSLSLKRSSVRYKGPQRGVLLKLQMQFVAFPWNLPQKGADPNIKRKLASLWCSKRAVRV